MQGSVLVFGPEKPKGPHTQQDQHVVGNVTPGLGQTVEVTLDVIEVWCTSRCSSMLMHSKNRTLRSES